MSEHQDVPADDDHSGGLVATPRNAPLAQGPYPEFGQVNGGSHEAPQFDIDIREYLRIFNKRKWVIVAIAGTIVALAGLATLMVTPRYTATLRLQIDRNVAKIVESGNVTPVEGTDMEFLKTQYELLQGRSLAERVAVSLRLGDDKGFLESPGFSLLGTVKTLLSSSTKADPNGRRRTERERAAASIILANRSVRPVLGSRLVDLHYSDPNPARAQKILTALAAAYSASNLDKRFQANAYAKAFLEDQVKQLKLRLEESEKQLLDFAEREQIVAVSEKSSIAESNLARANAALGKLVSERIKSEQLWRQVESAKAINMPQFLTNNVINGLRNELNRLTAEYQEKLETFKPDYPAMVQIKKRITEITRQLEQEAKTIKASLKASYDAARTQEADMKKQIELLRTEALDLQKRSIRYNTLKREVDTNRSLYEGLLQRQREVDVAGGIGTNNIFVVDEAVVPKSPSSPRLGRTLTLALMLGIGAGLGAAILLEHFDDTIRSVEEMERITGLPTLGIIPKVAPSASPEYEFADPRSALGEAYRSLCTSLQFTTASGLPRSLVVTSAGPAEGKSIICTAIARHFANMGLKVLLVDADMRNPSLHKRLGLPNDKGLSNYLTGACTPPQAFQATELSTLAFMSSGPLPPSAADLLGNAKLHSLLSVGLEVFDLIVVDAPPVMGLADTTLLANAAQSTVFVVGSGQSRAGQLRATLRRLDMGRARLIGTVLTKFDARAEGHGYGYGYSYAYGYGVQAESQHGIATQPQRELSA